MVGVAASAARLPPVRREVPCLPASASKYSKDSHKDSGREVYIKTLAGQVHKNRGLGDSKTYEKHSLLRGFWNAGPAKVYIKILARPILVKPQIILKASYCTRAR